VFSSASEKSAVAVITLFFGTACNVWIVYLGCCGRMIFAAYILLGVVSSVRMKFGAVSALYM
jgi:hypothetical protein